MKEIVSCWSINSSNESASEKSLLCPISIDSPSDEDSRSKPVFLAGDFSGDENIPSMDSRPCSSRKPAFRVIPVFLD